MLKKFRRKFRVKSQRLKQLSTEQTTGVSGGAKIHMKTIDASINIDSQKTVPASPGDAASSMFNNAQNTHITGGVFNTGTIINMNNEISLMVLYKRVAPKAILNAGGRADEVRCHPGTREEIIRRIEKWGDVEDGLSAPIFWLSGPAGAGKSAIVQTIAERCKERGVPHANFFFFRGDQSRSHASPLIATLLHQIILLYPSLRDPVATVLSTNPLLFDSTLEDQLEQLLVTPLRSIPPSSAANQQPLLLIDGLDECDSENKRCQEQIISAFDKVLTQYSGAYPFLVLVASRDESQIQVAFNKISMQCLCLYLDDGYSPASDIRVFVKSRFDEVRKTHRLAHTLDVSWPSADDINYIVDKSSGQFIFSATVMRFISSSAASPIVSLERVRGLIPSTKSPFLHLDAIYTHILSQVDDQEALKDILGAHLLLTAVKNIDLCLHKDFEDMIQPIHIPLTELLRCLNKRYTEAIILSYLEDLTSLMKYQFDTHQLQFHHASLSDYLLDHSRSGDYFVDTAAFSYKILPEVWRDVETKRQRNVWTLFGLCALVLLKKLPQGLMTMVISSIKTMGIVMTPSRLLLRFHAEIYKLCICNEDIINFRHFLRLCIDEGNVLVHTSHKFKAIPFGTRYLQMARAQRYLELDDDIVAALLPESDFDREELAKWLEGLLDQIHHRTLTEEDRLRLDTKWNSWADSNGISKA